MGGAGYDVKLQPYKFDYYTYTGIPSFSANGIDFVLNQDWVQGRASVP
jgi:hypothetical protein